MTQKKNKHSYKLDDLSFGPKRRRKRDGAQTRTFSSTFVHEDEPYEVSGIVSLIDGGWVITTLSISGERGVPSKVRTLVPLRPVTWGAAAADIAVEPPPFTVPNTPRVKADMEFLTAMSDRLKWLGRAHPDPVGALAREAGLQPGDSRLSVWLSTARNLGLLEASPHARAS